MTQDTSDLARQYQFNGRTLTMLADGMEAADWACRPGDVSNRMIAGAGSRGYCCASHAFRIVMPPSYPSSRSSRR